MKPAGQGQQQQGAFAFRKSLTMNHITIRGSAENSLELPQLDNSGALNNNSDSCDDILFSPPNGHSNGNGNLSSVSRTSSIAGLAFGGRVERGLSHSHSAGRLSSASSSEEGTSKVVAALYKAETGRDITDREMCEVVSVLRQQPEPTRMQNDVRCMEKLKMHLIHQGRHSEAKRFSELCQKLKGIPLIKNKSAIITLMYELFDKEPTRVALEAKRAISRSQSQQSSRQSVQASASTVSEIHLGNAVTKQLDSLHSRNGVADSDPTAMPNLSYAADRVLKEAIHRSQNRVPSLQEPQTREHHGHGQKSSAVNRMEEALLKDRAEIPNKKPPKSPMVQSTSANVNCQSLGQFRPSTAPLLKPGGVSLFKGSKSMEKELIKDLIYIFQGIDGSIIKTDSKGNIDIVSKFPVHPGVRLQTLRLAELGFFYKQIKNYRDKAVNGLIAQGFKHALDLELQEYYRLLAIVQSMVQQTVVDTPMSEQASQGEQMTLMKLTVWMFDSRPRLDVLSQIVRHCENSKGGELCSILYNFSLHGDPMIREVTKALLSTAAKPLYLMFCQWVLYGELEDPFGEFFIAADVNCKKEQLWRSKYTIRLEMLPSFISLKQAEKILATGKNINYLKEICQHTQGYDGREMVKSLLEKSPVDCMFSEIKKDLNVAIEKAYKTTSKMVLDVLLKESKLIDHLRAIKKYLLLGQGDFIQHLIELIQIELQKPASKLFSHNTSAIMESAVRATNSQFESEDVLTRLDTRMLPSSGKDLGWDVFCLDYKVHGPIGTVLTEDIMIRYNQLFNSLWRIKRVEIILNTLWKDQTPLFKSQRVIPELGPVLHRSQLLISELIHFVHQTQYYIMFEATECAWENLMEEVNKSVDLDQVIKAHQKFLETIVRRSLLDRESRDLLTQLRGIFDSVHELKTFLVEFDNNVQKELECRNATNKHTYEKERAQRNFFVKYLRQAKGKIETLYTTTQDLVRSFLLVLNRQQDITLQCLSFRLDFNEYYQFKDSRLSLPMTVLHRRLSSSGFDSTGLGLTGISMTSSGMNNSTFMNSMTIPE